MTAGDAWAAFVDFADILAGVFAVLSALVLAWPVWKHLKSRQRSSDADRIKTDAHDPRTKAAMDRIRGGVEEEHNHAARGERPLIRIGYGLLVATLVCLAVATADRALDRSSPPAATAGS